ncbi:MAG: carbohydrate-binding domain-containing protein [Lachnospiraceae bacterium]|nr:carbohydrate-binding domain-containing protein [Lachnospiraceae bacterium]
MVGKVKNKKKILIIAGSIAAVAVIIVVLMLTVFKKDNSYQGLGNADGSNGEPKNNENSTNLSNEVEFKDEELETIILTDEDIENGGNTIMLDGASVSYKGDNISVSGTDVIISAAGEYIVKGNLDDGRIVVDADSKADVTLIFAGVTISNEDSCGVYVKSADKVIINLADGTENTITDGSEYVYDDETNEEPNSAIFSKDDLVIAGTGKLVVNGNFNNGITSKDDLKITGGDIIVTAINNGIKGKDSIAVTGANINVTSSGDGLKADNETDPEKGYIYIESGVLNITSGEDAMQAATDIEITDGTFTIVTGEGSKVSSSKNEEWGRPGQWQDNSNTTSDTVSKKAIKATGSVNINGGTFDIDSEDDAIHANVDVVINKGEFKVLSGDDGMHADTNLTINDGTIDIQKSYEGIEATNIYICGGNINVVASDDGLNAAGGNDGSAMGRPGMGGFSGSSGAIEFTGGTLTMDAGGDGVDSNGTVVFDGGKVIVYGPTNDGNGTLDYQNSWTQNGGSFVGIGSSGMAQMPGNASKQNSVMIGFSTSYGSGNVVTVKNSKGDIVLEVEGKKTFSNVVFSNPDLLTGETYTIYVDGEKYEEFKISSVCTTVGNTGGMGGPGGMGPGGNGGMGGGRPGGFR